MNPPFFSAKVGGPSDVARVEEAITASLCGENGKCAFLRSTDYLALRMAALYFPARAPLRAYHSSTGLVVMLSADLTFSLAWMGVIESVESIQDVLCEFKPHPAGLQYLPDQIEPEDRVRRSRPLPALNAQEREALERAPEEETARLLKRNKSHPQRP